WISTTAKKLFAKAFGKDQRNGKPAEGEQTLVADFMQPFAMGAHEHTITATLKGSDLRVTIASNGGDILAVALASAVAKIEADQPKREPSQKNAILVNLRAAAEQIGSIYQDWIAAEGRDPRGVDKSLGYRDFMRIRVNQIVNQLKPLA